MKVHGQLTGISNINKTNLIESSPSAIAPLVPSHKVTIFREVLTQKGHYGHK